MLKLAVLVSGGGSNLQAVIDAIEAGRVNAEIALVVSTNDRAYALERAKNHGIPAVVLAKNDFESEAEREAQLMRLIKAYDIGLIALCGCLMILSADFIREVGRPIINVHPALLPDFGGKGFYGLRVHEAVISAGKAVTGATVHYVEADIDTGGIILQKQVAVMPDDTAESLQARVMREAEWQILPEVISMFAEGRLKL